MFTLYNWRQEGSRFHQKIDNLDDALKASYESAYRYKGAWQVSDSEGIVICEFGFGPTGFYSGCFQKGQEWLEKYHPEELYYSL